MEDEEVVVCVVVFLAVWFFYGLKWAILITITIIVVIATIKAYIDVYHTSDIRRASRKTRISKASPVQDEGRFAETGRTPHTISRRYNHPALMKQDLAFTDLQMNRNTSFQKNSLRSPQPLISQVNRHLSFNNMTYLPDQSRNFASKHQTSLLNESLNNSRLLSPVLSKNISHANFSPRRRTSQNFESNAGQGCYSPRCFSIIDPGLNKVTDSASMVKIGQPIDTVDGLPSFESILQTRLSRSKESPCSRHSVMTALSQKANRKRQARDNEGSFIDTAYTAKKRRRDELDDFLEAVSDLSKEKSYTMKALKRPSLHNDENGTSAKKNKSYNIAMTTTTTTTTTTTSPVDDLHQQDSEVVQINSKKHLQDSSEHDSGVALSISGDLSAVKSTVKAKKRKSVTFSKETKTDRPSPKRDKVKINASTAEDYMENRLSALDGEEGEQDDLENNTSNISVRFFPNTSLGPVRLSPITKPKKSKIPIRSSLTWKDIQESRREAWRRSQNLLDNIEQKISEKSAESDATGNISIPSTTTTSTIMSHGLIPNTSDVSKATSTISTITSTLGTSSSIQNQLAPTTIKTAPNQTAVPFGQATVPLVTAGQLGNQSSSQSNVTSQSTVPALAGSQLGKQSSIQSNVTSLSTVSFGQTSFQTTIPASGSSTTMVSTQSKVTSNVPFGQHIPLSSGGTSTGAALTLPFGQTTSQIPFSQSTTTRLLPSLQTTTPSLGHPPPSSKTQFPLTSTNPNTQTTGLVSQTTNNTTSGVTFGIQTGQKMSAGSFGNTGSKPGFTTNAPKGPVSTTSTFGGFSNITTQSVTNFKPTTTQATSSTSSLQTFKFQAKTDTALPTAKPSGFSFQPVSQNSTGLPSTTGLFNAPTTNTAGATGFTFGAQTNPTPSSSQTGFGGVQQKTGGFSFNAPAVNQPTAGFAFPSGATQTTATPAGFGSPAVGGFTFGAQTPGTPFASSTPMPGMAGVATFAASGGAAGGAVVTKSRQRSRRVRK